MSQLFPISPTSGVVPLSGLPFGVPFDLQADAWMPGPYHITNVTFYVEIAGMIPLARCRNRPGRSLGRIRIECLFRIKVVAEADSGAIGEAGASLYLYRDVSIAFAAPGANQPVAVGMPTAISFPSKTRGIFWKPLITM